MKPRYNLLLSYFIVSVTFSACTKINTNINTHPTPTPIPTTSTPFPAAIGSSVSIVLHPEAPGLAIPTGFEGLSFDLAKLTDTTGYINVANTSFINLINNLGTGYLRIGGNSSDNIVYTENARNTNTGTDSLTTSDIDRLAAFSNAVNWKVIFGLNLGNYNTTVAANEAVYLNSALGSQLYALQFGNEPNDFVSQGLRSSYAYNDYQTDWNGYFSAIRAAVPNVPLLGPDATNSKSGQSFITQFATAQNANIKLLDGHYYVAHPKNNPVSSNTILATDTALLSYLAVFQAAASQNNLNYRISESNSITGGGVSGVSNGFASSLWALDYMWILAEHGSQGVNFHGGNSTMYSPIIYQNGVFTAQPLYYGMLVFKNAAIGNIIPLDITNSTNVNCTVHASFSNNIEYVTIVNKDTVNAAAVTITPNRPATSVQVMRLTAPSVTSLAANVSFAGSQVNTDGTFQIQTTENYSLTTQNFIVNVPAGSAAVVQIK